MKCVCCFLALSVVSTAAPPAPPEGQSWEKTTSSSFLLPAGSGFKVITDGTVRIRGGAGPGVSYTLRQRVTARSQAEADRLFRRFAVQTLRQGDWTVLVATHGRGLAVDAELVLEVPRNVRQSYCKNISGAISVADLDGPLQIESGGGRIEVDRLGATLNVKNVGGEIRIGQVKGQMRVLSGAGPIYVERALADATLETAGGEIVVREAAGPILASTAGGGVRVGRAAGNVTARTAGGRIEVDRAGGWVIAENTAGPIQVGAARGVRCEASSGAIRLRSVSGALQASTAMGNILAEIANGMRIENSFLNTGNGDITVFLPSNIAATIQALNDSGSMPKRIISEFPEIHVKTIRLRPSLAEGALNGGGPVLRLTAAGGTIYLRRLDSR